MEWSVSEPKSYTEDQAEGSENKPGQVKDTGAGKNGGRRIRIRIQNRNMVAGHEAHRSRTHGKTPRQGGVAREGLNILPAISDD